MLKYSVVICVMAAALTAVLYHNIINLHFPTLLEEEATDSQHSIAIGVLSARGNAAQRQALRETWAGYITNNTKLWDQVIVKFIVGNESCDVPREFLEDPYSCRSIALNTSGMDLASEMVAFNITKTTSAKTSHQDSEVLNAEYYGLDFTVNYPVVIKKLGLHDAMALYEEKCTVTLYDTWSKEPIIRVNFSTHDSGTTEDSIMFKNVEEYLFPKDFHGTIVVGPIRQYNQALLGVGASNKQHIFVLPNNTNILSIKPFQRKAKTDDFPEGISFPNFHFFPGNFIFELYKPEEVETLIASKGQAEELLLESNQKETQSLCDEQQEFGDLLLVDGIDVYRNIPNKMLQFFHWVIRTSAAKFIIKTDDDCFMNIDNIMATLEDVEISARSRSWWGNFRTSWPLDLIGKWAEHDYPAPVYPAFACGSGNLLTQDLVQWIVNNSKVLHAYQGEDVSMGIWLGSILPSYVNDRRWACDSVCHRDVFVLPEQSPEQLRAVWRNWIQCKDPCGCHNDKTQN